MRFQYLGTITERGSLQIQHYSSMCAALQPFHGKDILITIEEAPTVASMGQRNYFFGVVLLAIHQAMLDAGNSYTKEEVRNALKNMFGPRGPDGSVKSMSAYTKADWQKMTESCEQFGMSDLHIIFPKRGETT
jgi:hypothetical protein